MKHEEVARRFDNRPGYRLIDYGPVGLPISRLVAIGILLAKKDVGPIEEFVLRGINAGLRTSAQLAGFLGLPEAVVHGTVATLIGMDCVRLTPDGTGNVFTLTAKGHRTREELEHVIPLEQSVVFHVDGLTRKPEFYPPESLLRPRDLRELGAPEIPSFPSRHPDLSELKLSDVASVLRLEVGKDHAPKQLLALSSIERRDRLFLPSLALIYKSSQGNEVQVAFTIDGRLSYEHEKAFALAGGPAKTNLFRGLSKPVGSPPLASILGESLASRISREMEQVPIQLESSLNSVVEAMPALAEPEVAPVPSVPSIILPNAVRTLAVYEHPMVLRNAIDTCTSRLLIISPWIRRGVVDKSFVSSIAKAIARGVSVSIGFGLGEDRGSKSPDREAKQELIRTVRSAPSCNISELGDTHAKVLICDSKFFVISSFNWLSFKGDQEQTFREEWGTMVSIPELVDEYYKKLITRFHVRS